MFFSCPHCRELVATDRETRLPPPLCPRCGGVLREDADSVIAAADASDPAAPGARSFVSFLRAGGVTPAPETTPPVAATNAADEQPNRQAAEIPRIENVDAAVDGIEANEEQIPQIEPVEASPLPSSDPNLHPDTGPESDFDDATDQPVPLPLPLPSPTSTAMPSFTRRAPRAATHARGARWQWAALVVLAAALFVQVLIADRSRLAADPQWRPLIVRLCATLGCTVPSWHQPSAFLMLNRDVSPVRGSPGTLQAQATFRNDAPWPQRWPVLLLSLSDADGRTVGARAFTPAEYMGAAATQSELGPGQSAEITFRLHEPNPDVVAFSFDFR